MRISYKKFEELYDGPVMLTLRKINKKLPESKKFLFRSGVKLMIDIEKYEDTMEPVCED